MAPEAGKRKPPFWNKETHPNKHYFTAGQLFSKKRTTLKKASTAMSKAVSKLSKPEQCQVCDCIPNADGQGRLMCHKCILPTIDIVLQNWEKYGANFQRT